MLTIEVSGETRQFAASALPVSIGGDSSADVPLAGVSGAIQIGLLDDVFFLQPGRNTRNLRVDGALVTGSRKLRDGEVIALDRARLTCGLTGGQLTLDVDAITIAADTAPPDLDELARAAGPGPAEVAITPIAFKSKTDRKSVV